MRALRRPKRRVNDRQISRLSAGKGRYLSAVCLFALFLHGPTFAQAAQDDETIALSLASMLRAGRTVVSANQQLINNPELGDKGLTGQAVLDQTIEIYRARTGTDPNDIDPESRHGRLLQIQMTAIREVMDENQRSINKPDVGFKGFVPAVFARLVNERFKEKIGQQAEVKVTAPKKLVRNRKALPDQWETEVIRDKFLVDDWPKDQPFSTVTDKDGRKAYRILVPEYYGSKCLACHGEPEDEIDITGYPKEGGKLGQLGGVISITLYQ